MTKFIALGIVLAFIAVVPALALKTCAEAPASQPAPKCVGPIVPGSSC